MPSFTKIIFGLRVLSFLLYNLFRYFHLSFYPDSLSWFASIYLLYFALTTFTVLPGLRMGNQGCIFNTSFKYI
jgi:hypothetical protein